MRELEAQDLDGLLVVNLTYGPAMRIARLLAETKLPICLANIQPVAERHRAVGHGRPDLQPGHPRRPGHGQRDGPRRPARSTSSPTTGTSPRFTDAVGQWARAAAAITRWRQLKVAVFGYAMNGMGDISVDRHALIRTLGPQIDALAPGDLVRAAEAVSGDDIAAPAARPRTRASRSTRT